MFENYSEEARKLIQISRQEAAKLHNVSIYLEHLFLAILHLKSCTAYRVLSKHIKDTEELYDSISDRIRNREIDYFTNKISFSEVVRKVLKKASTEAYRNHSKHVGSEHILLALLLEGDESLNRLLISYGLNYYTLKDELGGQASYDTESQKSSPPQFLEEYGVDLNNMALEERLDPLIGREDELDRIIQVLCRRNKNNPILVGEPGVGKTAIVEGLAQRIASRKVPEILKDYRIFSLDIGSLVAGTKYRGQFEDRMKKLIKEVRRCEKIIIFIDEIHSIIGAGAAEGSLDASSLLKPALARGEFQCIGSTTTEEYRRYIEKDGTLDRRFQEIRINPPSKALTVDILKGLKSKYEEFHRVKIDEEAIEKAVELSDRYVMYRNLPDKAIDILDEACSRVRLHYSEFPDTKQGYESLLDHYSRNMEQALSNNDYENASKWSDKIKRLNRFYNDILSGTRSFDHEPVITGEDIEYIVSKVSGIPVYKIEESEVDKLLNMESEIHKYVVGQDIAVKRVSDTVRRSRSGINYGKRPIGSFMFLGPTGVGKTELAKVLAEFLFGSKDALLRIDMSEYMEKFSVSRLIGSPPGYVGYEDGGQLTNKVKRKPYSVILLDEIEKAHPDVFNILLQIFEEGELTDSIGNKVSFRNTIIILTSNIGASKISKSVPLGFAKGQGEKLNFKEIENMVMAEVKNSFNPEFINRLDDIIVFHPLTLDHIIKILDIQQNYINDNLKSMNISIRISEEAKMWFSSKGFSSSYGARPLRRIIQKEIEDRLATMFLKKELKSGDEVVITAIDDRLNFNIEHQDVDKLVETSILT